MGWHERHASVFDRGSRGILRPETLNLEAWITCSAASSASKGKGKKKRWTKTKIAEKRNHVVLLKQGLYDKISKEIVGKKVITVYNMIESYKVNGAVARKLMKDLAAKGKITPVLTNSAMSIYTGSKNAAAAAAASN